MAWGILELPEDPTHLSVYASEAYYTGPDSRLRRFTYRADGFVSLHADSSGELLTRQLPLVKNGLAGMFTRMSFRGRIDVDEVVEVLDVHMLEEFGSPEAVWEFRVERFPAVVTMDSHGGSLHEFVLAKSQENLDKIL